ncbi:MAG: carbohydrate binding family 9 domain-containing protein [Candidatus Eisenbacteria bacterium]
MDLIDKLSLRPGARTRAHDLVTLALLMFCAAGPLRAEPGGGAEFAPQFHPTATVPRISSAIRIDGSLDDAAWHDAVKLGNFAEVQPGDQIKPMVESEAWLCYDSENLYIALIAHDDSIAVRAAMHERDDIFRDDYFGVMLDPYGDLASGYEFFVNPLGIQGDLRMTDGGNNEDEGYDAVWNSRGRVTGSGYQVEIAMPFASLRFSEVGEQRWRANFWRDHPRDVRRRYAWAAINRDDPCWMCNWGTLTGLTGIRPGSALDVIANAIGSSRGELRDFEHPDQGFHRVDDSAEASLNLRYSLSTNATAELAINPDFSQIESDATQIDVNKPFALFYPERRPFFQEGADTYGTWIDAVYTRSILNPEVAGKLTARFGRLGLAYTAARDEDSPYLAPLVEGTRVASLGRSFSQLARARHTFGKNSFLGALVTDRRIERHGGSNTLASTDGAVQFFKNYRLESQIALSHEEESRRPGAIRGGEEETFGRRRYTTALDGESYDGHAIYTSLERSGRSAGLDFDFWEYAPTFRAENGFVAQNDYRQANWWNGVDFSPNGKWVQSWGPRFGFGRIWTYAGALNEEWIRPHANIDLKYQTGVYLEYWRGRKRWDDRLWSGVHFSTISVDTRPNEYMSGSVTLVTGRDVWRARGPEATLAKDLELSADARIKATDRLVLTPSWSYVQLRHVKTDATLADGYILRTRVNYQFSRELAARCVIEFDEFADALTLQPLLTYRWNALTVFYLGYGSGLQHYGPGSPFPDALPKEDWRRTNDQFFAKLQYLLRV